MKFSRYISLLFILMAFSFTACQDDLLYDFTEIGEGEANLNVKIEFHSLEPALGSRSAGNACDRVDKLWMVIYKVNADGSEAGLYEKFCVYDRLTGYSLPGSDFNIDQTGNSGNPIDAETASPSGSQNVGPADGTIGASGQKTPSATFKLSHIPFGRYKMFAVANVDLTDVDCTTISDLKSQRFDWQTNVSLNNQMFGYFTATSPTTAETSAGFDAPIVVIDREFVSLHSWIKRLVSKVTVSFDGSDLKENVRIYIKSVTIHDIPKSCALGEVNSPTSDDDLIKNGESFVYYQAGEESDADHEKWDMIISKGLSTGGQSNHTESDPALYFYENMQGDYPGVASKDKRQDPKAVGTPIDSLSDGPDYKDSQLYGTYIEVIAYYDSRNKDKITQGPIRYRFMLGKNSTYNYDAERNFHYKLTLKFRGWANEADWHISYKEYTPTFITPEPYYISYLYDQELDFPGRVILPEEWDKSQFYIKAEIVENNWFPWDRKLNNGKGGQPQQFVGSQTDINGFAWNTASLTNFPPTPYNAATYDGNPYKGGNYVGFLSLRPNTSDVIGTDAEVRAQTGGLDANGYGTHANQYLEWYYKAHNLAVNTYELSAPGNTVDPIDKSVRVKIMMYTRNKEMVPSTDFTGNNPFSAYYRYAKVRLTLWQRTASGDQQISFKNGEGEWETERLSTIYQVPRIENPKAIYRDANNDDEFEIKLMIKPRADATSFEVFKSDGPWRAYVETQSENFVQLYDKNGNLQDTIHGSTDEEVIFTYKPNGVISDDKTRSGIIRVEYHDYNCAHLIFVRQGYHVGVQLGDAKWSCYNVYASGRGTTDNERNSLAPGTDTSVPVALTRSPLSIGSFLKRNNYNYSIREENIKDGYGWLQSVTGASLSTAYVTLNNTVSTRSTLWSQIQGFGWTAFESNAKTYERYTRTWANTWTATGGFRNNETFAVPTADNYKALLNSCKFGYGVVYADGSTTTKEVIANAFGFTDYDNDGVDDMGYGNARGIRACVVYNESDGTNIIFPLGSLAQGRRSRTEPYGTASAPFAQPGQGSITYPGMRQVLTGSANNNRPYTYNVYRDPGALYWVKTPVTQPGTTSLDTDVKGPYADYASWDINYLTLVFNPYAYESLGGWDDRAHKYDKDGVNATTCSDALPIKLIYQ